MNKREKNVSNPKCGVPLQRFPIRKSELDRFKFGKEKYNEIARLKADRLPFCLDVACGGNPFPKADVLCDLHLGRVPDRGMKKLVTDDKPFVLCSIFALPFKDKAFDLVTSYYLIEHLDEPQGLLKELRRVSNHGYVQCPSWFNEFLYGERLHRWTVRKRGNLLYIKPVCKGAHLPFGLRTIFHKLYKNKTWQIWHAILDEQFHLFTVKYEF